LGHLSRSRDVIGHVSIRLPIWHFLLVVNWYWASRPISHHFRDIQRQSAWPVQIVIAHARISRDLYPLCKIWVHIWISHSHIAYSLWHFYWAPMKKKGFTLIWHVAVNTVNTPFTRETPMLNAKSSENFLSADQNWEILAVFGVWVSVVSKIAIFTPKGTYLREPTSFEPFCVKIDRRVWPPGRLGKNKVTETPIGKTCRR